MYTLKHGPLQRYQQLLEQGEINSDPAQQQALEAVETLYRALAAPKPKNNIAGLYLWGEVGRGKTFLVDLLVASLQERYCLRQHFHHFMASIHRQLQQRAGQADPLKHIARQLSRQYRVLCFDEFFVADIGDAMLLGRLLHHLFHYQVILVATSNTAPERLYWNGLQRQRFLPAIEAIIDHTDSLCLSGPQDHRLRLLTHAQNYFIAPLCAARHNGPVEQLLAKLDLSIHDGSAPELLIQGRTLPYLARNQRCICFTFAQLCEGPRSHCDYIELAERFDTLVLLDVPPLSGRQYEHIKARGTEDGGGSATTTGGRQLLYAAMDDGVRRFIALVDELYDQGTGFFVSSPVPLDQLYTQGSLTAEFKRARSRLMEMASLEYQHAGCKRTPPPPQQDRRPIEATQKASSLAGLKALIGYGTNQV